MNLRPLGYEPNELPDCSTPQFDGSLQNLQGQILVYDSDMFWILFVVAVLGADVRLPGWLDAYPGTKPEGKLTFHFKTADSPKKVLDFYAAQVTKAGLEVTSNSTTAGAGMLLAEDRSKKRQVVVTVSATGDVVMSVSEGP